MGARWSSAVVVRKRFDLCRKHEKHSTISLGRYIVHRGFKLQATSGSKLKFLEDVVVGSSRKDVDVSDNMSSLVPLKKKRPCRLDLVVDGANAVDSIVVRQINVVRLLGASGTNSQRISCIEAQKCASQCLPVAGLRSHVSA